MFSETFTMAKGETTVKIVTQRDIAKALGVSNATVSLALRDSDLLTVARRREIQEAARRMGYRLNPAAAELARHKQNSLSAPARAALAWVNAWNPPEKLRSYRQFDAYWTGAAEAARKLGYHLEEFRLDAHVKPERLNRIFQARGIRGILLPPQSPHPDWGAFPWNGYSVVRFGRSLRNPEAHVVSSDHVTNTMIAFARMRELGYRRIGLMTNEDAMVRRGGHLSEAGFLMAQRLVPQRDRVPICVVGDLPNTGRGALVAGWVEKHRIDAILTDVAESPQILAKGGLRAPADVGLACTNVMDIRIPAGIHQNPEEVGRVALLMLHSLITDHAPGIPPIPRQLLVEGRWVDGPSLPPR